MREIAFLEGKMMERNHFLFKKRVSRYHLGGARFYRGYLDIFSLFTVTQ